MSTPSPQSLDCRPRRVSSAIYLVIWIAGLPVAFISVIQLQFANQLGLNTAFALILATTSAGLLTLIYFDMDTIEKLQSGDHDYPEWVGLSSTLGS